MSGSKKIYVVDHKVKNELQIAITSKNRSIHRSLKWVLLLAQCFGQIPVQGITDPDARHLRFTWKSWRVLYCLLNCIGAGVLTIFYVYYTATKGYDLIQLSTVIFHVSTFIVTVLFLKLAIDWPHLMHKWSVVEYSMRSYGWPRHLNIRITLMSSVLLTVALLEYALTKANALYKSLKCKRDNESVIEYAFRVHLYPELMSTMGYALWKAILLQIESILVTFAWTFNDLFIMLISTAIALRFKQISARVRLLKQNSKAKNISTWKDAREDYNRLSQLTRQVDHCLSYIILTSFASNLFFILLQLFNSLREMPNALEKIYFFLSFGLLILRTICVSIYGAWIYDESKEPLATLNSVSSETYNVEIRRFTDQIKFDTVALTGKNFFNVTRGLVLSMAGAVVTYELVLIQFNENLLKESAVKARNSTSVCN